MNNSLRALAQKAKYRLRAISTNEENVTKACLSAKMQYAIIASQKKIEDDPLYNKVKKLLEKDPDTTSPLSQLIEHNIYDKLSERDQEKYMFKLSKRYIEIREHIIKELMYKAV